MVGMINEYLTENQWDQKGFFFQLLQQENLPINRENIAELMSSIDVRCHAETEHYSVFAIKHKCPIDHVDEQMDVGGIGEVSHHGFKHLTNQFHPTQFVHKVQGTQLLCLVNTRKMMNEKWTA